MAAGTLILAIIIGAVGFDPAVMIGAIAVATLPLLSCVLTPSAAVFGLGCGDEGQGGGGRQASPMLSALCCGSAPEVPQRASQARPRGASIR